jgi:hypothetical protein
MNGKESQKIMTEMLKNGQHNTFCGQRKPSREQAWIIFSPVDIQPIHKNCHPERSEAESNGPA